MDFSWVWLVGQKNHIIDNNLKIESGLCDMTDASNQMVPSCLTCYNLQAWPYYRLNRPPPIWTNYNFISKTSFTLSIRKAKDVHESSRTCETCAVIVEALVAVEGSTVATAVDSIFVYAKQGEALKLRDWIDGNTRWNVIELFTIQRM